MSIIPTSLFLEMCTLTLYAWYALSPLHYQYTAFDIRESVDSLCRDGADMPRPPYIGKACTRPNATFVSLFSHLTVCASVPRNSHKVARKHL